MTHILQNPKCVSTQSEVGVWSISSEQLEQTIKECHVSVQIKQEFEYLYNWYSNYTVLPELEEELCKELVQAFNRKLVRHRLSGNIVDFKTPIVEPAMCFQIVHLEWCVKDTWTKLSLIGDLK